MSHMTKREMHMRVQHRLKAETPEQARERVDTFGRVSGLCVCKECGFAFFSHPVETARPFLTVLCDLTRVKL